MGSCSTSTDVAVWKPPLFSFAPTPPVDRKFIAAARRLDRIRTESNGTLVWWQSASAVHEIARQLDEQSFAVIDKFGGPNEALETRNAAIQSLKYQHGTGGRINGAQGNGGSAVAALRSDVSTWLRAGVVAPIDRLVSRADELVARLRREEQDSLPGVSVAAATAAQRTRLGLNNTTHRSHAMLAVYPRGGAKYVRHLDNVCVPFGRGKQCNGRRLTAVYYLQAPPQKPNKEVASEGEAISETGAAAAAAASPTADPPFQAGALRIFAAGAIDSDPRLDVSPDSDRLVLFWSDSRVPHAVLPTGPGEDRYAITLWYFDEEELERANQRLEGGAKQEALKVLF